MKRLGIALLATLALPVTGEELSPVAPRSLFTTSAGITEPGAVDLEFGGQRIYHRDGAEDTLWPTQLNFGLTSWLDLRLGWNGPMGMKDANGNSACGSSDPMLGSQVQILRQDTAGVDAGFAYWHKIPTGDVDKGISTGCHDDTLLMTLSRSQGRWTSDLNIGANWIGSEETGNRVRQGVLSLALTYAMAPGWSLSLDTYALSATTLGHRTVSSILAVSRTLSPNFTFDMGVEAGLTQEAPRMALTAGFAWRIGSFSGRSK